MGTNRAVWHDDTMGNDINEFIRTWGTYHPITSLRGYRDAMAELLDSDDEGDRIHGATELLRVLDWMEPPVSGAALQDAVEEQRRQAERALTKAGLSPAAIRKIMRPSSTTKLRDRGRPRSRGMDAVQGLDLRLRGHSWRDVVLEIEGPCKDRRNDGGCTSYCPACDDVARSTPPALNPRRTLKKHCPRCKFLIRPAERRERVCYKCADRMADLVQRLEALMRERDLIPNLEPFVFQREAASAKKKT